MGGCSWCGCSGRVECGACCYGFRRLERFMRERYLPRRGNALCLVAFEWVDVIVAQTR